MLRNSKPKRYPKPRRTTKAFRNPKPLKRALRYVKVVEFDLLNELSDKKKEGAAVFVQQYTNMREKFIDTGRHMYISCPKLGGDKKVSIEKCFTVCEEICGCLDANVIKADNESLADFMEDFIRFQRLANLLFGVSEGSKGDVANRGPDTRAA